MEGKKLCSTCKEEKALSEFSERKKSPDGLSYSCKSCQKEQARQSYQRRKLDAIRRITGKK